MILSSLYVNSLMGETVNTEDDTSSSNSTNPGEVKTFQLSDGQLRLIV